MKLSDMFASLAGNARDFEERVSEWQAQLTSSNEDMMVSARKWQEAAKQRQEELNKQMQGYFEEANENVRAQWQTMQTSWEEQFRKMQEKGEEMRAMAMKSGNFSDWAEAYAAQMVTFAQKMQDEAANAIAAATEARGSSGTNKSKKG